MFCSCDPQHTNVVRVELVDADEDAAGCEAEGPGCDLADDGELADVNVVGQDRVKPDVGVRHDGDCEDPVQDRVDRGDRG